MNLNSFYFRPVLATTTKKFLVMALVLVRNENLNMFLVLSLVQGTKQKASKLASGPFPRLGLGPKCELVLGLFSSPRQILGI